MLASSKKESNLSQHLIDGDGGKTFLLLDDAGLEIAAPAIDLVIKDTMLFAVGEPDTGFVAGREDGDARGLNGCGKVHGSAVVAEEDTGVGKNSGALAWAEVAA